MALCELLLASGSVAAAEALLGWWAPPPPKPRPLPPPPPPPPSAAVKEEDQVKDEMEAQEEQYDQDQQGYGEVDDMMGPQDEDADIVHEEGYGPESSRGADGEDTAADEDADMADTQGTRSSDDNKSDKSDGSDSSRGETDAEDEAQDAAVKEEDETMAEEAGVKEEEQEGDAVGAGSGPDENGDDVRITDPDHPLYEDGNGDDLYQGIYEDVGEEGVGGSASLGADNEERKSEPSRPEGTEGKERTESANLDVHVGTSSKTPAQGEMGQKDNAANVKSETGRRGDEQEAGGAPSGKDRAPRTKDQAATGMQKGGHGKEVKEVDDDGPRRKKQRRSRSRSRSGRGRSRSRSTSRSPSKSRSRKHRSRSRSRSASRTPSRRRSRSRSRSPSRNGVAGRHRRGRRPSRSRSRSPEHKPPITSPGAPEAAAGSFIPAAPVRPPRSIYSPLLRLITWRPQPARVAATAARVMRRLHAYELIARFTQVAAKIITRHSQPLDKEPSSSISHLPPPLETLQGLREVCAAMAELAGLCALPEEEAGVGQGPEPEHGKALPKSVRADAVVINMLTSRSFFHSAAGLLMAMAAQSAKLKRSIAAAGSGDSGTAASKAAAAKPLQMQLQQLSHLHGQLVTSLRVMFTTLLSTSPGLLVLSSSCEGAALLAHALDPTAPAHADITTSSSLFKAHAVATSKPTTRAAAAAASSGPPGKGDKAVPTPATELSAAIKEALVARAAVSMLEAAFPGTSESAEAVYSLVGALSAPSGLVTSPASPSRQAALFALSHSPKAVQALLRLMKSRGRAFRAAFGAPADSMGAMRKMGNAGDSDEEEEDDDGRVAYHPESLYAHAALLELVREVHVDVLPGWAPLAEAIAEAARMELESFSPYASALSAASAGTESSSGSLRGLGALRVGGGDDRAKQALREIIGRAEAAASFQDRGMFGMLDLLDSALPRLVPSSEEGAQKNEKVAEPKAVLALARAADKSSQVAAALTLLSMQLSTKRTAAQEMCIEVYGANGMSLMERALRTGTSALAAAAADGSWSCQAGDALDDGERLRSHQHASSIMSAAAACTHDFLLGLKKRNAAINSAALLDALLKAHARLCLEVDSLAACLGSAKCSSALLRARQQLAVVLGIWLDAQWKPAAVPVLFGVRRATGLQLDLSAELEGDRAAGAGGAGAPEAAGEGAGKEQASCNLTPLETFTAACLLGDLLPTEWPLPQQQGQQQAQQGSQAAAGSGKAGSSKAAGRSSSSSKGGGSAGAAAGKAAVVLAAPEMPDRRGALAAHFEQCQVQLRRLVAFGATSESRMMRCATVRLCSKAAGLSGGMGMFLAQPLLENLQAIVKGTGPMSDGRRVLEMLVPLSAKPAMKAGLLELKAVSTLSRFTHKLVHKLQEEGAEGTVVLTMSLECLTILANPDVSLNCTLSQAKRLVDDVPTVAESAALVAALLACLPHLGSNASYARNLILAPTMGLATYPAGRAAIRQGAAKWYLTTTAGSGAGAARADTEQQKTALTWASGKLWDINERYRSAALAAGTPDHVGSVAHDLAKALDDVASRTEDEAQLELPSPTPVQQRFAAALEAAEKLEGGPSADKAEGSTAKGSKKVPVAPGPLLVTDAATLAFWRYCRARNIANKTALPARKLAKWDAGWADVGAASTRLLPEGLSRRKRPRETKTTTAKAVAESTVKRPAAPAPPPVQPPGAEIPTVVAPRRPAGIRSRSGHSGRPPSMHVDDYERKAGGGASTGGAGTGPAKPPGGGPPPGPGPMPSGPPMMPPGGPNMPSQGGMGMGPMGMAMGGGPPGGMPIRPMGMGPMGMGPRPGMPPPLQTYDSDSLYADLFNQTPRGGPPSTRGSGPVDIFAISTGNSTTPRPQPPAAPTPGSSGGSKQHHPAKPPPPSTSPPMQQQQPAMPVYSAPYESAFNNENLYESLYDAGVNPEAQAAQASSMSVGGGSGGAAAPSQLEGQPSASGLQTQGSGQIGGGASVTSFSAQQIMALLKDPARLKTLLATNPNLAKVLQAHLGTAFQMPK